MLVIHPKDKTTAMLSALYDGLEAQVVADYRTTKEMGAFVASCLYTGAHHVAGAWLRQRTVLSCG